jgi:hypothetical protein
MFWTGGHPAKGDVVRISAQENGGPMRRQNEEFPSGAPLCQYGAVATKVKSRA